MTEPLSVDDEFLEQVQQEISRLLDGRSSLRHSVATAVWRSAFAGALPRYPSPDAWRHPAFCEEMTWAGQIADDVLEAVIRSGVSNARQARSIARQGAAFLRGVDNMALLKAQLCAALLEANRRAIHEVTREVVGIILAVAGVSSTPAAVAGAVIVVGNIAARRFCEGSGPPRKL